jgi:hypothetical protein
MNELFRHLPTTVCRIAYVLIVALAARAAHATPPDACAFLSASDWSAALGRQVTGGTLSTVDNPESNTSSCLYRVGMTMIVFRVSQFPSATAAKKEFADQLDNSHSRDERAADSSGATKSAPESGLGDGAFSSATTDGVVGELMAVQGSRIIDMGFVATKGTGLTHDKVRAMMQKALNHS